MAKLVARFYDPLEGACASTASTCASSTCTPTGASSASCCRTRSCSRHDRVQHPLRAPRRERRRGPPTPPRLLGLDRLARRFAEGLDHPVREGGTGLSAGERQLISIARALLADPRILILDEATSNIDRPTELLIERALDRLLAAAPRSSSPTGSRPSAAPTSSWSSTTGGSPTAAGRRR